jgi:hypothetical protein
LCFLQNGPHHIEQSLLFQIKTGANLQGKWRRNLHFARRVHKFSTQIQPQSTKSAAPECLFCTKPGAKYLSAGRFVESEQTEGRSPKAHPYLPLRRVLLHSAKHRCKSATFFILLECAQWTRGSYICDKITHKSALVVGECCFFIRNISYI